MSDRVAQWIERVKEAAEWMGMTPEVALQMPVESFIRAIDRHHSRGYPKRWTNYEPVGFKDGTRGAWVTYQRDHDLAERRCVGVSEISRAEAEAAPSYLPELAQARVHLRNARQTLAQIPRRGQ